MACTPQISYDKKGEENNKNKFTNKHIIIFQQKYSPWASTGAKRAFAPLKIRTKNQKFVENMKSAF